MRRQVSRKRRRKIYRMQLRRLGIVAIRCGKFTAQDVSGDAVVYTMSPWSPDEANGT